MRSPALLAIAAVLFSALVAGPVRAQGLQVSPILVELTRAQTNAIITLRNEGGSPVRYQLSAASWDQDSAGQLKLAASRDLILFPLLLSLQPGEQRNVRVGVQPEQFGPIEKTYRVFVEQMPPPERPGNKPAVQVLTRVGIPVFLEPETPVPALRVERAELARGKLSFRLQNVGNVRIRPAEVVADALSGNGTLVIRQRWDGWYVLAGQDRAYEWSLPQEGCGRVRSVRIEARLDEGRAASSAIDLPGGACGP